MDPKDDYFPMKEISFDILATNSSNQVSTTVEQLEPLKDVPLIDS